MEIIRVARWGDDSEARRYYERLLSGMEGLAPVPPGFPIPKEAEALSEEDQRFFAGRRILRHTFDTGTVFSAAQLHNLCDWLISLVDECQRRSQPRYWRKMIHEPHASLLAEGMKHNTDRARQVLEFFQGVADEMEVSSHV